MYKEKNVLQTCESASEYLAPKIKVVKIRARRVMCQSNGSTESYGTDSWNINN